MSIERGGGGISNGPRVVVGTRIIGEAQVPQVDFLPGYPDTVQPVFPGQIPPGGVDRNGITEPAQPPAIPDIDTSGGPQTFEGAIVPHTTWPTIDVALEPVPDFHVLGNSKKNAADPSTPYTGAVTVPSVQATIFSGSYTPKTHLKIPVPPAIEIVAYAGTIPEFKVTAPEGLIEWIYETYTSSLLEILKEESDGLLTCPVKVDTTAAIARDNAIWESPSLFLAARGITPLTMRETVESNRLRDNIHRLIAILEANYREESKRLYLETRQALENLERKMYEARKEGELAYAKAWAENRINHYLAVIESYNQLLNAYRMLSLFFQEQIAFERAKLAGYRAKVEAYAKAEQVDDALFREYLAQVETVNATIRSYETSMSISEAIANITLMKAEMERLNTESFVLRTQALANAARSDAYFDETETMKLDLLDADIAYAKAFIEKSAANLERTVGMLEEEIEGKQFESEKSIANIMAKVERDKALHWAALARADVNLQRARALEEKASALRQADRAETQAQGLGERLAMQATVANDRNWRHIDLAYISNGLTTAYAEQGFARINEAEAVAADSIRKAQMKQKLTQTVIAAESS